MTGTRLSPQEKKQRAQNIKEWNKQNKVGKEFFEECRKIRKEKGKLKATGEEINLLIKAKRKARTVDNELRRLAEELDAAALKS